MRLRRWWDFQAGPDGTRDTPNRPRAIVRCDLPSAAPSKARRPRIRRCRLCGVISGGNEAVSSRMCRHDARMAARRWGSMSSKGTSAPNGVSVECSPVIQIRSNGWSAGRVLSLSDVRDDIAPDHRAGGDKSQPGGKADKTTAPGSASGRQRTLAWRAFLLGSATKSQPPVPGGLIRIGVGGRLFAVFHVIWVAPQILPSEVAQWSIFKIGISGT